MEKHEFAKYFDHTLLKPEATRDQVLKVCQEASQHKFYSVCINSHWLPVVRQALQGTKVRPICVIGFPLGASSTPSKIYETRWCIEHGAEEIDMVLNIGAFKSGDVQAVQIDVESVVKVAAGKPVKVILETGLLNREEIVTASQICADAGAAFVKTSTGFGPRGASIEDIRAMQQGIAASKRHTVQIKASGGIRDLATALAMIEAGASRLGVSASVSILEDFTQNGHKPANPKTAGISKDQY